MAGNFGDDLNLAIWQSQIKLSQAKFKFHHNFFISLGWGGGGELLLYNIDLLLIYLLV